MGRWEPVVQPATANGRCANGAEAPVVSDHHMMIEEGQQEVAIGAFLLEAAPIGGQPFAQDISRRDCTAFLLLFDTYDTRLLAQALSPRGSYPTRRSPARCVDRLLPLQAL